MSMAHRLLQDVVDSLELISTDAFRAILDALQQAVARGKRIYVMGNGGSASTASHLVCDLTKQTDVVGASPMRVMALTDNAAVVTAWANDASFELAFARQLALLLDPGDVVIAISTSGASPNVVAGLRTARERGAVTIGLLGPEDSLAAQLADVAVHVTGRDAGVVETAHLAVAHALTAALRSAREASAPCVGARGRE